MNKIDPTFLQQLILGNANNVDVWQITTQESNTLNKIIIFDWIGRAIIKEIKNDVIWWNAEIW